MASRKSLKKYVKAACSDLLFDCVALKLTEQADNEKLDQLMVEVLNFHNDYVSRLSHIEKGKEKEFFTTYCKSFTEKANALTDEIAKA